MNPFIAGVTQAAVETFQPPEPILEVGSFQVPGQEHLANLRPLLAGKKFLGIDMREGPGVDRVANVQDLPFEDNSFGTVVALNTFEHVERFWVGFQEIQRVLRPDGLLMVSCPFYFHIHDYPYDYWRFTPQAYKSLLADMPNLIVGWHGPTARPLEVWAVAGGAARAAFTEADHEAFRERIRRYARQPVAPMRRFRYALGRLIAGRRPFAPELDGERFETELVTTGQAHRQAA